MFICLCVRQSICRFVRVSVCSFVGLSVCPCVRLRVHLSMCPFVCVSISASFVCVSICAYVRSCVHLSVCPFVCPFVLVTVCVSNCPYVRLCVHLSVCVSMCQFVRPCVHVSVLVVRLSMCQFVRPSVHVSVCPCVRLYTCPSVIFIPRWGGRTQKSRTPSVVLVFRLSLLIWLGYSSGHENCLNVCWLNYHGAWSSWCDPVGIWGHENPITNHRHIQ